MVNINNDVLLEEKLLQILRTDNEDLLRSFLINTLNGNREYALTFFKKILDVHQGKQRFKILEILMQDGKPDLIPLMVHAIKIEKNVLFAKSLMFLYGNFEHPQALEELMEMESSIHFDLEKSYQKVAGKLKAIFREMFYISEFKGGEKNSKRMHHAADMMIATPHESYPPFLNEMIGDGNLLLRKTAARTLHHLGNADSLDTLFEALPRFFMDRSKTRSLGLYMLNENTYETPKLNDVISTFAMLGEWDDAQVEEVEQKVRTGDVHFAVELVRQSMMPDETLITKDIFKFLQSFLEGATPPKSEIKRLERLFGDHEESQTGLLQDVVGAIGAVGYRLGVADLLPRMEAIVSADTPDREELIATFLGGYKSDASMARLLELIVPGQNPDLINKVLAALSHYTFDSLPEELARLCRDTEAGLQRQTAMDMVARSGHLPQIFDSLLEAKAIIVQVDAIQTAASHKVEDVYPSLLAFLTPDINARLKEVVITALDAFPCDQTGEAVKPYMAMPNTYLIRFAAMKTMLNSGGDSRISLILGVLADYPDKTRPEMLHSFLKLVEGQWQPDLLKFLDFWRSLLDDEAMAKVRPMAIDLLDKVDWRGLPCEAWLELLQHIIEKPVAVRTSQENKTLRIMVLRIRANAGDSPEEKKTPQAERKQMALVDMVKRLKGANLHEKVRSFRLLNLHYKQEWSKPGDMSFDTLLEMLSAILDSEMQLPDLIKSVYSLIAKIKDEELTAKAKSRLKRLDPELAEYGKTVLDCKAPATKGKPIERVLILDDTVLIAKTLQRFLTKSGFTAEASTQPGAAMELLDVSKFDLLVCDLLMPGMNGFQFILECRRRAIAPPNVIMITSSREHEVLQHAARANINGLLLKPFPIQDLLEKIQHLSVPA